MATAVANRYARALVDVVMSASSQVKPEDAVSQLRDVEQMVTQSHELQVAMLTPAIQTSRKRAVMGKLLDEIGVASVIRNFVFVVIDHRRIGLISELRQAFELLLDERLGYVRAEVTSAAPLDAQRGAALESELSRLTGKRMRLHFAVDPSLLGGVMAQIGSTVYDGSVRGELQQLRQKLTEPFAG